jgi:hypothetical protein
MVNEGEDGIEGKTSYLMGRDKYAKTRSLGGFITQI